MGNPSEEPPPLRPKRKRWLRRWVSEGLKLTAGLAVSGLLGWMAIRGLDWGSVVDSLSDVSPVKLILALAVFMSAGWLRAMRWKLLFTNEQIPIRRLFIVQHEGLGFSNVMPFRVVSEVTQLAVLTLRDGIKGATALATLSMERVIDAIASTGILAVSFLLVPEMRGFTISFLGREWSVSIFVWAALAFTVFAILLVRLFAWSESLGFVTKFRFLAAFAHAVGELEREKKRLVLCLAASVVYWLLVGATAWLIATALDLPISPVVATVVVIGTIFFATAVPAAPSAIGAFEFAVVNVLGLFGFEENDAFVFAVVCHAVFFLPATIIAAIFLPREGVMTFNRIRRPGRAGAKGA